LELALAVRRCHLCQPVARHPSEGAALPAAARPWLRPLVDYGPLAAFFLGYVLADLLTATAVLMAATLAVLLLSLVAEKRVPLMPLITAAVVGVFGGLTLWLQDETFIKMKPTIVQLLFALALIGGLAIGKAPLKALFGTMLQLDEPGWRKLTLRWAIFFLAMAGVNEAVWRLFSTDVWVAFKVFGIVGVTLVFALAQIPLMQRHQLSEQPGPAAE
ncbi:MAG: septation protein A, partial [Kiloniellales bacterium]